MKTTIERSLRTYNADGSIRTFDVQEVTWDDGGNAIGMGEMRAATDADRAALKQTELSALTDTTARAVKAEQDRDSLQIKLDTVTAERDRLQALVTQLQAPVTTPPTRAEIDAFRARLDAAPDPNPAAAPTPSPTPAPATEGSP